MAYSAEIPFRAYWSTPFARWQGSFANLNSIEFAAHVAKAEFAKREGLAESIDHGVLGISVPQKHSFYGLPWLAGLAGLKGVAGPAIMQACATGVRTLLAAVEEVDAGLSSVSIAVNCDRTSNGPHVYYPNPRAPGGTGAAEDWVMDNFNFDPLGRHAMIRTAENVAMKHQIATSEQHEAVLVREAQYRQALADDSAFLRRFMTLPFQVPDPAYRKTVTSLDGDEGVNFSTPEGLAKLKPVLEGGSVTFGGQTHPADGNAAIVVAKPDRARELSADSNIRITLHGFGTARAALAHMPEAPVPAARKALAVAGKSFSDIDAIKTHNPFAINDVLFSRDTGVPVDKFNNYGCSLVWGHPQAPMGTRSIIELIEELVARGGGWGLFTGCAAGDSAMAVVLHVDDRGQGP
ncbi:thiolase family protein [Bradyrhizobium sp.]|uniref:thiolase family protein n=1 Tax=Bradyrhizobium sp. TaxID=376 RepID=UPI00239E8ECA|nr:thiolase family protein [Bradyrhizobium sp.]MDE2378760.1 thiolase family protein [Bradyrhizobium sp.]